MRERRRGHIVNAISMGRFISVPGISFYCSKRGRHRSRSVDNSTIQIAARPSFTSTIIQAFRTKGWTLSTAETDGSIYLSHMFLAMAEKQPAK